MVLMGKTTFVICHYACHISQSCRGDSNFYKKCPTFLFIHKTLYIIFYSLRCSMVKLSLCWYVWQPLNNIKIWVLLSSDIYFLKGDNFLCKIDKKNHVFSNTSNRYFSIVVISKIGEDFFSVFEKRKHNWYN